MKTIPLLVALLATVSCLASASFARAEHTRVTIPRRSTSKVWVVALSTVFSWTACSVTTLPPAQALGPYP